MNKYRKRISILVVAMCAVIFTVFALVFLNWQSELMVYSQKVLSSGLTHYNPEVGCLLITGVLLLLAYILYRFIATSLYFLPAVYFLPSLLVLAVLTDGHITPTGGLEEGSALPWAIALTLLVIGASLFLRRVNFVAGITTPLDMAKSLFINLLFMVGSCFLTVMLSNTNRAEHVGLVSEKLVSDGKYDEAVKMINLNDNDDDDQAIRHSVMIKALALSKEGSIGDRFFERPMPAVSSKWLYPSKQNRLLILSTRKYFRKRTPDYKLLACMLDKNLTKFASTMKSIYGDSIPQQLPRYYKEALIAYRHTSATPLIDYKDEAMEEDFNDFHNILRKKQNKTLSLNELRDSYGDTYWWYFFK